MKGKGRGAISERMGESYHIPVMVKEVLEGLRVREGGKYIDCTLGGGGHALEIIKRGGIVLGIDQDQEAIEWVREQVVPATLKSQNSLITHRGNFADLDEIAKQYGFGQVDGILYDLGVSSHQLGSPARGFSFSQDGPLDMRMDLGLKVKASDLVNVLSKHELTQIFRQFGQAKYSRSIAQAIVRSRRVAPITTTARLAEIVSSVVSRGWKKIHPATQVFQALRLAVNSELENLKTSLSRADPLLKNGGRLVIISFHSLEDRIAKHLRDRPGLRPLTKGPVRPQPGELVRNPRARSAKLRVYEKVAKP